MISTIRGMPVILDADLAAFFDYTTSAFNQRVKANLDRFPEGFAFQLTTEEWSNLKSQNVISSAHGGRRKPPWAFTEHGAVMAATVLKSERAVAATRQIVEVFVEAKHLRDTHQNLPAPLTNTSRNALTEKLEGAVARILDAIADPVAETTIRDEARALALEGLNAIKARLAKQGVANEKTLAEAQKLIKEAERLDAEIESIRIENEHRRLAFIAKQLQIVIELQRYLEGGSTESLMSLLTDLRGAK
ncbi:MAG: ORF6N domain-containing protein [Pseudomonadota bacterium]